MFNMRPPEKHLPSFKLKKKKKKTAGVFSQRLDLFMV